ncbi:MAG TPA: tetratricopeptide repeat protein [Bryobacteraceae bacterium]|nr:tetratricopeptide repeat protein [Bryobacteraceae bacterium]
MTARALLLSVLLFTPTLSFAQRNIQELQRDVAQLQDMVRNLQQSQNEKMAALTVMVQQALDAANKANTSVAVLDNSIRQTLREQAAPVAGVGAKVDQMATEFQALRESVSDISSRMAKMQAQMVDINNAVRTINAPAAPPPGDGAGAAGLPPAPAETLYANAQRDRLGGKPEMALQGFSDYLKYYPTTDLAPNAQYYIAEIHFSQGDFDSALKEFDMVLEKYPDNNKTADAIYMKGQTLVKMGRRTQGGQEFQELIKRFPGSDLAKKACSQLTGMGLKCSAAARPARKKK